MVPYLTDVKLKILVHLWRTQKKESMKNLVAAYALNSKNFSGTISLKRRVGIVDGVLLLGYCGLWIKVFKEIDLDIDNVFAFSLFVYDRKKGEKHARQQLTQDKSK